MRAVAAVFHRSPNRDWDVDREEVGDWEGDLCSCLMSMVVTRKLLMNDVFWHP